MATSKVVKYAVATASTMLLHPERFDAEKDAEGLIQKLGNAEAYLVVKLEFSDPAAVKKAWVQDRVKNDPMFKAKLEAAQKLVADAGLSAIGGIE